MESREQKRQAFLEKAKINKANFELHIKLIEHHLCDRENKEYSKDLQKFATNQVVDGNLLLSLIEYAESCAQQQVKNTVDLGDISGCLSEILEENRKLKIITENGLNEEDWRNDCV